MHFLNNLINFKKKNNVAPYRILLVDDHQILLNGLRSILDQERSYEVIDEAADGEAALNILKQQDIDILITDYSLPKMDGLALTRAAKKMCPDLKIIVLSMHRETHLVKEILKEGIDGYVLKSDSTKELVMALEHVVDDKTFLSPDINKLLIRSLQYEDETKLFSDREREILKLIAKELSSKQIAHQLFISERTVETHRRNMMKKSGKNTTVGLINFGYENNLL